MDLYVSNQGREDGDGSKKRPAQSIEKAMELVRRAVGGKNQGTVDLMSQTVTVHLEEGIYYLEKPLCFTPEDSGMEDVPIVYEGCGKAVISGGRRVYPRWEAVEGGIYRAFVGTDLQFDQFFVNGEMRILARYPDFDESVKYFQGYSADCLSPERVKGYAHPEGGYIHAMHQALWGDMHYQITGKAEDGRLEYIGGWQNNRPSEMHPEIRFIENVFEELDSPKEWFCDGEGYLYYYPPQGEDLEHAVCEVACLKNLITVQGTEGHPVRHLTFSGIVFRHAKRTFMEPMERVLRSDWCVYRGGAIFLEGTEQVSFVSCHVAEVGGNGIVLSRYNRGVQIRDCEISDAGANAILFIGDMGAVRSPLFGYESVHGETGADREPGPATSDYPARCLVEGNLIYRNGRVEKQTAGVSLSVCSEIALRHNTIYDVPRAGINICDGTWGGHVLEKNAVFHTVRETNDHGAFNSWGRDRYWDARYDVMEETLRREPDFPLLDAMKPVVIRDNVFECADGWDIDLDDGSSNYLITGNLCLRGGIKNREGVRRQVVNNVMLHNTFHPHVWFRESGDVFERNVVFRPYADMSLKGWGDSFDYNLLYDTGEIRPAEKLREKSGMDGHSLCGSFRFCCDREQGFRILDEELRERLGIRQLDVGDCGVTDSRLKEKAASVFDLFLEMAYGMAWDGGAEMASEEIVYEKDGMSLKPLRGLDDVSATGMHAEKGVLVVKIAEGDRAEDDMVEGGIPKSHKWRKRGFRERDVILAVNGWELGALEAGQETDVLERVMEQLSAQTGIAEVWREQAVRTLRWNGTE